MGETRGLITDTTEPGRCRVQLFNGLGIYLLPFIYLFEKVMLFRNKPLVVVL